MTKQKSGADEKTGPTRARAAKIPAAAAIPPAEENVAPAEETISRVESAEEEPAQAWAAPVVADAPSEVAPAPALAAALVPASTPEPAEAPTQIVLLGGEAEATVRDEPFSWPGRNLEFWKENTQAFYRLTEELGAARTPGQIVEAQTKFAVERLRAFGRHAEAIATVRVKFFFAA